MLIPINKVSHNDSIERLEKNICEYTGAKYALALSSGTAGLFLSLLDIKDIMSDAEILLPAYGYPGAYKICRLLDLKPVPVEMDYQTMGMNLEDAKKKLTNKTLAIVHVESSGVLGNLDQLKTFAKKHKLNFIEDSASALVQNYNGINAGRFGDVGIYSFAESKVLNSGEGGAIVTDNELRYKTLRDLRYSDDYSSQHPYSLNFNMSPWLGDLLNPQFENIDDLAKDKERVHDSYKRYGLSIFEDESVSNRYQYIIYRSPAAWKVTKKLDRFKIGYRHQHYSVFDDAPIASKIKSELIELPTYFKIADDQIQTICNLIRRAENGML